MDLRTLKALMPAVNINLDSYSVKHRLSVVIHLLESVCHGEWIVFSSAYSVPSSRRHHWIVAACGSDCFIRNENICLKTLGFFLLSYIITLRLLSTCEMVPWANHPHCLLDDHEAFRMEKKVTNALHKVSITFLHISIEEMPHSFMKMCSCFLGKLLFI